MRLPKLSTLIVCKWMDIVGQINSPLSESKPQRCKTVGWLARVEKDYIVIATSIYEGEGDNPTIDGCAIPLGCIESVKRV
jgi:hypothetical protein